MPIGAVENRNLECVTINSRRAVELEQFSFRKVELYVLTGQQGFGVGAERQAAGNVGSGDLKALPSGVDGIAKRSRGSAVAFNLIHHLRQIVVIDDFLRRRALLTKTAGYISEWGVCFILSRRRER
jgi:hypothetical protein